MSFVHESELSEELWEGLKSLYRPGLLTAIHNAISGKLPKTGLNYVARCLREPSRNTESSVKSSSGKYPSNKLGRSIGFESSYLEYLTIIRHEMDPECIALLDQGHAITVLARSGARSVGYQHRPDFVCIRHDSVKLIECKTKEGIQRKNEANPGFFVFEGGRWKCPTAEAEAKTYGFIYEVWTDLDFSACELRNSKVVERYLCGDTRIYDQQVEALCRYIDRPGSRTIDRVLEDVGHEVTVDGIFAAIARRAVSFDMDSAPLTKLSLCELFRDDSTMLAYRRALAKSLIEVPKVQSGGISLQTGDEVMWNAGRWRCVGINEGSISLVPNADIQPQPWGTNKWISVNAFLQKLKSGEMTLIATTPRTAAADKLKSILQRATEDELAEASKRYDILATHLQPSSDAPQGRSVRRWLKSYKDALLELGNGFAGLLPSWRDAGNRTPRLEDAVMKRAVDVINRYYLAPERLTKAATYRLLHGELEAAGYRSPSYKWFCGLVNAIPPYEAKLAREGRKGAYRFEPRIICVDHEATPVAELAMELVHIDHTKIDLVVRTDGEPIRLWLTVMICAATRRIVSYALSFEPPSYRQVILAIRECVKRHSRLPRAIVVDGGKEFRSTWFETFCALYHVKVQRRPKSKARFGAQIERFFGTVNTQLFYTMIGNTQNTRNVRQMTAEVDPYKRAIWTADDLKPAIENFFFEVYDTAEHSSLMTSPRDAFESSMATYGSCPHLLQNFDETFLIFTSATTRNRTAKVQPDGVKINYFYYNHPSLRFRIGESLPVRFDPFNIANAWVQIDDIWLKVTSRHASVLANHSEHDLAVVTAARLAQRSETERKKLSEPSVLKMLQDIFTRQEWIEQRHRSASERMLRSGDAGHVATSEQPAIFEEVPQQPTPTKPKPTQRLEVSDELYELEMSK